MHQLIKIFNEKLKPVVSPNLIARPFAPALAAVVPVVVVGEDVHRPDLARRLVDQAGLHAHPRVVGGRVDGNLDVE